MSLARHWRLQDERYKLIGRECTSCGRKLFPSRDICPHCGSRDLKPYKFAGTGEIYSYSTIYHPPAGYEGFVPYTVALIRLDEGPLVTAQLTDADREGVEIGQRVEMVTRRLREYGPEGLIVYGYKFRPLLKDI